MARVYSGGNGAFTPSTAVDNYTLDTTTAGVIANIRSIGWGGSGTATTGYRTRWTRPTAVGTGAQTTIAVGLASPNDAVNGAKLVASYATTPGTLAADPAGNLHAQDWNVYGGIGYVVFPLADPWLAINGVLQGAIACRNTKGTDASLSSYQIQWEE
jgi:hypothetical protein